MAFQARIVSICREDHNEMCNHQKTIIKSIKFCYHAIEKERASYSNSSFAGTHKIGYVVTVVHLPGK